MPFRAVHLGTAAGLGLAVLSVSCAPMSDLERTKDHLAQARESLVRSLAELADDIDRSLTEVDAKLADPALRPEERGKLLEARSRLLAATDKASATVDRELQREDLLPEERDSLLLTEAKLERIDVRVAMTTPVTGTRAVQERLAALGYKPGKADGMMGPRTRAAIRAFERDHGMPQTGKITPELASALATAPEPEAAAR
jgi:hypothetical protein